MKRLSILLLIAAGAFAQAPTAPAKGAAAPTGGAPALEPGLYAIINTSMGTITAQLFEKETPGVVKNFVALANGTKAWKDPKTNTMVAKPLYRNLQFHRVIPKFMIQTGDPTATGGHDCGFTVKDEIVPSLKFDRPGRLGLARLPSPNTGSCQFFITEVPYPSLDGQYTVFGQVVQGQEIVAKISGVPRDANDKPRTPVMLTSVTIKRVGPAPAATGAPATKKSAAPAKTTTATPKSAAPKSATPVAPKK
jgi:cyclophilin family peptidyl-prolyl cis-trans isomerase